MCVGPFLVPEFASSCTLSQFSKNIVCSITKLFFINSLMEECYSHRLIQNSRQCGVPVASGLSAVSACPSRAARCIDGSELHSAIKEEPMLILTRRVGETLTIGDDVTVTVLAVKGNQVRIGIDAPEEVAVHRQEIYDRIRECDSARPAA